MPFCPKCRYEYKPEIWECPDCGVRLVEKLEDEEPEEELVTDESTEGEEEVSVQDTDFVPVACYKTRFSSDLLQETLEKEGIRSIVINRDDVVRVTDTRFPVSRLIVWVQDKDFEKAKEIAEHQSDNI
jgi:transcription initiation factor TFIIIB Brf1 subunit/transcription initiation factor TFIIB